MALFVDDFSLRIPRADAFGRENHYPTWYGAWHSCAARVLGRYLEWAGFYHFLKLDNEEELSEHTQEQLAALYKATVNCGPPFVLEMDGAELVDLSTREFDSIAVIELPGYSEHWRPWYEGEIAYPDPERHLDLPRQVGLAPQATPNNLRLFAASSMEMFNLIEREVDLALPFDDMARTRAFKDIASCYLFDEWAPLFGGPSLRDRITAFIHRTQADLGKEAKPS
ncbi:MAG: hypothetical protein JSS68_01760 [Actinobacteria bacterium]|nr:hypothetical protein [Actinomycetota bacterium]